jgi:hypothetical protein
MLTNYDRTENQTISLPLLPDVSQRKGGSKVERCVLDVKLAFVVKREGRVRWCVYLG